jgi:hypothetical protein
VAPAAAGVAGDVHANLNDQLGLHERDSQRLSGAPPGGERPAGPGVPRLARGEVAADRVAGGSGEGGGAADVLQTSLVVVSACNPRGDATGPVTAPTIASVVSRTLYFSQPRTPGSYRPSSRL